MFKFTIGDVLREKQNPSNKIRVVGLDFTEFLYEFGNISKYRLSKSFVESNFELETSLDINKMDKEKLVDFLAKEFEKGLRNAKLNQPLLNEKYSNKRIPLYAWESGYSFDFRFLPTKIIFDYDKKKTTLLFGNAPYESYSATANGDDEFNVGNGFVIAYFKYRNRNNGKHDVNELIKYFYDFSNTHAMFVGIVTNHLLNQGMSFKQVDKLFVAISETKSVNFNIDGNDYHVEIEVTKKKVKKKKKAKKK